MSRTRVAFGLAWLFSLQLMGGTQSLVLSSFAKMIGVLPSTSVYAALGDCRIEGQVDRWVDSGGPAVGIWELDSDMKVYIVNHSLVLNGFSNESVSVNLASNAFRWVGQRNRSTGRYTLEVWDQNTGVYSKSDVPMAFTGTVDRRGRRFSIGSFYEATVPNLNSGFLRWYSTTRPLGGAPPPMQTNSPADLLDFEFEGNLKDLSANNVGISMVSGTPAFVTTAIFPPAVNLGPTPLTIRAGTATQVDATASFSNGDLPNIQCVWSTVSIPAPVSWGNQRSCATTVAAPVFGTYYLRVTVIDSNQQAASKNFKIGAVATDDNDVVVIDNPQINRLLGPMIRFGANPWRWADDRSKALADLQITLQNTTWLDYWNTASPNGTVTVVKNSPVVTGTGTHFQSTFCGGAGQTAPVSPTGSLVIWYNSTNYPGTTGRGFYAIKSCDSDTQLTLARDYIHSADDSSLRYAVGDDGIASKWLYGNTPANYYDNVLAFYAMYYRTGIDDYRTAARTLAYRWWTGPNWDRGQNFDFENGFAGFINAGPARGQSVTGLILWSLDTGTDIWPGVHHLWNYWTYIAYTFNANNSWNVQIGNTREIGYMTAGLALCALYDGDSTYRSDCSNHLSAVLNLLWKPLEINNTWQFTNPDALFTEANGNVYVNVVDGSPDITLTGWTWSADTFSNDTGAYKQYLWFINDPKNNNLFSSGPTRQNSDVGDTTAYRVSVVTDPTHAVLTTPYNSGSCPPPDGCNKGLAVSHIAGFGTLPYMNGLAIGAFGTYVYEAVKASNVQADIDLVLQMVRDGTKYLSTVAYDATGGGLGTQGGMFGAREFMNCELSRPDNDPYCASGIPVIGEATRAYSAGYLLTKDPTIATVMDTMYQRMWCKPGWPCPFPNTTGSYMSDIDDGNYMLTTGSLTNKWLGFFFGYGFTSSWPAARVGGLAPVDLRTESIPIDLASVVNARSVRVTTVRPSGFQAVTTCAASPCGITVDARQGSHLIKVDYLSATGQVLAPGELTVIGVMK